MESSRRGLRKRNGVDSAPAAFDRVGNSKEKFFFLLSLGRIKGRYIETKQMGVK